MKTLRLIALAALAFIPMPLLAGESANKMGCACCKKDGESKEQEMERKMEAKMKAEDAEFDKLVSEMNAATGDKKIEAMSAIINKMAQKQKEMKAKCAAMMGMMKKDSKPEATPAAKPVAPDHYTCKMHPEVHWPVPAKCPLCSMDLVPVFKKGPNANPGSKTELKPGEELKKAEDPHAGHN
jgi:hypothetical protein